MDNQEISRNNSSAEPDGVASAITGSTSNDVSDCNKSDESSKENCGPKTAEASPNSTKSVSTIAADVLEGTGSISSDGHKQHVDDMQSNFAVDEPPIKQNKDAKRQNVIRRDLENTEDDNCSVAVVAEAPNTLQSRDERVETDTKDSVTVDQSFEKESANSEAVLSTHTGDEGDTENSQACTCTLNSYGVAEKVLRDVSEKSEDSNDTSLNKVDESVTEQSQSGNNVPREESDLENNSLQDCSSVKGNEDYILKMDSENESVLEEHGEVKGIDLSEVSTGDDSEWQSGGKLVGQVESCTESDLIMIKGDSVNSESGEVLGVCDAGLNLKEERGEDKEVTHEQVTLDSLHSICVTENMELESQNNAIGLSNSSEKIDESDKQLGKTEEEIQVLSDYTEGSSKSAVRESSNQESNQSVAELQAELPKTSGSKKKKSKKEKCKEGEEKTKSKGKSEKKKKKEKKSDNEQIVDSERKVKEGKKSRSKEPCTKEQKMKDSNTCREDLTQKLAAETKGVSANDCGDGSGDDDDDDDNWELNFDESGDCLKPEHLEEVCFVDLHTEATSTTYFIYKHLSHTLGYHSSLLCRGGSFINKERKVGNWKKNSSGERVAWGTVGRARKGGASFLFSPFSSFPRSSLFHFLQSLICLHLTPTLFFLIVFA